MPELKWNKEEKRGRTYHWATGKSGARYGISPLSAGFLLVVTEKREHGLRWWTRLQAGCSGRR